MYVVYISVLVVLPYEMIRLNFGSDLRCLYCDMLFDGDILNPLDLIWLTDCNETWNKQHTTNIPENCWIFHVFHVMSCHVMPSQVKSYICMLRMNRICRGWAGLGCENRWLDLELKFRVGTDVHYSTCTCRVVLWWGRQAVGFGYRNNTISHVKW